MSVTHLEEFVQMMVKSSSARLATEAVDGPNWRETLHRLVARCYRSKDKSSQSGDKVSFANTIQLANGVVSEYSPVVSLYDVLKFKPNDEENFSDDPTQDEFLYYFGLNLNNNTNQNQISEKPEQKVWAISHPRHLLNTPHVPFSSDLGMKLIKERPEIPQEIHERKIERLERYLQNIPIPDDIEYEVTYNKNLDIESSHFYTFPTKNFHDRNKLTPRARHLLKKYCKPCSVKLRRIDPNKINCLVARQTMVKFDQKENVQLLKKKGNYSERRVIMINNLPRPSKSFQNRTNYLSKPISSTPNERKTRLRNFLKTLTPRNENRLNVENDVRHNDFKACVVLQPINNFIKLRSNKKTLRNMDAHVKQNKRITNDKVEKKKVNTCYPRRFSPRLKIVNSPRIM